MNFLYCLSTKLYPPKCSLYFDSNGLYPVLMKTWSRWMASEKMWQWQGITFLSTWLLSQKWECVNYSCHFLLHLKRTQLYTGKSEHKSAWMFLFPSFTLMVFLHCLCTWSSPRFLCTFMGRKWEILLLSVFFSLFLIHEWKWKYHCLTFPSLRCPSHPYSASWSYVDGFNGIKALTVCCCWEVKISEDAVMEIAAIVGHVFFKTKWLCSTSKYSYSNLGKKYFRGCVMLLHLCCTTELSPPKSSDKGQSWRVMLSWHNGQSHHTLYSFPFCSVFSLPMWDTEVILNVFQWVIWYCWWILLLILFTLECLYVQILFGT